MSELRGGLQEHLDLLCCPRCQGDLEIESQRLRCRGCGRRYEAAAGIPQLFCPNKWKGSAGDVTDTVKAFYEETPFPDYDQFDSVASLMRKAREGRFARMLDEQIPPRATLLECGCGTGQLSSFLSVGGRTVFATDISLGSLRLGADFARRHDLRQVHFVQMNLFRPAFKKEGFHLVIANGVLHHTSDPFLAIQTIGRLVKPGGYLLIGLYHRYGRLITDARRVLFRVSGDRLHFLDPTLRRLEKSDAKRRAWFADQYEHPHETKHTLGEALRYLADAGFRFVRSIPSSRPFRPLEDSDALFEADEPGNALERFLAQTEMIFRGSREGGLFVVIGQRT